MARERTIETFILKKQDYAEADQIITLFSKQEGKLRCLVKAAKMPTSKLQPMLQPIFQTRVSLTGHANSPGLAKVIGVQLVKAYSAIFEQESKMAAWYVASELAIRALPDNAPNELFYLELERYANFLNDDESTADQIKQSVVQFQIKALHTLGLGIRTAVPGSQQIWFSLDGGGFTADESVDAIKISLGLYSTFQNMRNQSFSEVSKSAPDGELPQLQNLVNRFVTYQLEREIKSQQNLARS
jgi:DNA repair protein RecO